MQLMQNEKILFQAMPLISRLYVISNIVGMSAFAIFFPILLWSSTNLILFSLLLLTTIFKCFDKIIITNQRMRLRILFINRTTHLSEMNRPPYLTIQLYSFRKHEWQRKLLRQDFQKFWQNRASICFSYNAENKELSLFNKKLILLKLNLFSKNQVKQILKILAQTWQLDPTIQAPINLPNKSQL